MLKSLHVESFRGVRAGSLDGFGQLAVLVGPNGAGKSTLLDAMIIAGSSSPGIGRVVSRRSSRLNIQYRVIYRVSGADVSVYVVDVTAHDYRRR